MTGTIRSLCLLTILALAAVPQLAAQRGDDSKRLSKNGKTTGTIDGVSVTLEYGRPNVKGRAIWGSLVPHGRVWRTGADEATTITFDQAVLVEGKRLEAGTYSLFTIPGESEWTIVFNKVAQQWGAYSYDSAQDVLRVVVTPQPHDHVEALAFAIEGGKVVLTWEKLAVPFAVAAAG